MQTTNATYGLIKARGKYIVEYKAEINGVTYDQSMISGKPQISSALFEKFSIGNAVASSLKIIVIPQGTIPAMSSVDIYFRIKDRGLPYQASPWYPKGKFFIDTRKLDKVTGTLTLECFDAMLKAEYTFMESGTWTSSSAYTVVQTIANDMGITVDQDTKEYIDAYTQYVPSIPIIGEDGTTGREMLEGIASMYGGNFIIDEFGHLKLIRLEAPEYTHQLGVLSTSLDTADAFDPIDRVILKLDEKTGFKSPADTFDTLTGRILEAYCPWTTQELADFILSIVNGYTYQPYEALGANLDPAGQLGDGVVINGVTSAIYSEEISLDPRCACDISAPYEEEVNHEYPYRSPAQRTIDNAVTQEDLATAGRTEINGANITTGTITLGGANNGQGQVVVLDADGNEIGRWSNVGLQIFDDSATGTPKFDITDGGTYPSVNDVEIRQSGITLRKYKSTSGDQYFTQLRAGSMLRATHLSGSGSSSWVHSILEKVSGTFDYKPQTFRMYQFGDVIQLYFQLTTTATTVSAGNNLFVGTIKPNGTASTYGRYLPVAPVCSAGFHWQSSYAILLEPINDEYMQITVRSTSNNAYSSGVANIGLTYLVQKDDMGA